MKAFLCISAIGVLTGCSTARYIHEPISLAPASSQRCSWKIDTEYFVTARAIELLPFGGGTVEKLKGDFFELFVDNSNRLMTALFGSNVIVQSANDPELGLRVSIGTVTTKSGRWAYQTATFDIEMRFTIRNTYDGGIIAEYVAHAQDSSDLGTTSSAAKRAHQRANRGINKAFEEAKQALSLQLPADLGGGSP